MASKSNALLTALLSAPVLTGLLPGLYANGFAALFSAAAVFGAWHASVGRLPELLSLKPVFAACILLDTAGVYFTAFSVGGFRVQTVSGALWLSVTVNLLPLLAARSRRGF